MDFNTITTTIGSLGFPIVACCYMFYIYNKQVDVINELKIAINKLIDRLDDEDKED